MSQELIINVIQRFKRGLSSDRGYYLVDLDDDRFEHLKESILENTDATNGETFPDLANEICLHRTKDIYLCSRDAKGAKLANFTTFASALSEEVNGRLAFKDKSSPSSPTCHTGLLSAKLMDEQVLDERLGEQSMTRYTVHIKQGNETIPVKVEFFK